MQRKVSRQTKRRLSLIILLTIIVLLAFSFNLMQMITQVDAKNKEATFLKGEIKRLEDEESYLRVEVEKFNDPDYVARYARERYLYSKDGEFTIKIPDSQ